MNELFKKLNQHFSFTKEKNDLTAFQELEDTYNVNIPLSVKEYYANYCESSIFDSFIKLSKIADLISPLETDILYLGETLDETIYFKHQLKRDRVFAYKKGDVTYLDGFYDKSIDCFMLFLAAHGLICNQKYNTSIKISFSTYKEMLKEKKLEYFFKEKSLKPYFLNVLISKGSLCTYQVGTQSLTISAKTKSELEEIIKYLDIKEKPKFTTDTPFLELCKFTKLKPNKLSETEINDVQQKLNISLPLGVKSFYRFFEKFEDIRNSEFMFRSIHDVYVENDFLIFGTFSQGVGKYGVKLSELNNNIEHVLTFDESMNQWCYETAVNTESFLFNAISVNLINQYPIMAEADISEDDFYDFVKAGKIECFVNNIAFNRSYYNISTYKHKTTLICYVHTINKVYFGAMSEASIYKLEKVLDIQIGIL